MSQSAPTVNPTVDKSTQNNKRNRTHSESTSPTKYNTPFIKRLAINSIQDKNRFGGQPSKSSGMTDAMETESSQQQTIIRLQSTNYFKSFQDPFKLHTELNKHLTATLTKNFEKVFINRHNNQLYIIIEGKHASTVVPHLYQLALISTLTYITEMPGTDGLQYIYMLN